MRQHEFQNATLYHILALMLLASPRYKHLGRRTSDTSTPYPPSSSEEPFPSDGDADLADATGRRADKALVPPAPAPAILGARSDSAAFRELELLQQSSGGEVSVPTFDRKLVSATTLRDVGVEVPTHPSFLQDGYDDEK